LEQKKVKYSDVSSLVARLSDILTAQDVTSIKLKSGTLEIGIEREKRVLEAPAVGVEAAAEGPPAAAEQAMPEAPDKGKDGGTAKAVISPRVGILHLKDPKTGEPFVVEKDVVKKTTKLAIIKSLGQSFTVKSGIAGTVARILVQDGQAVEYGQPIVEIGE